MINDIQKIIEINAVRLVLNLTC